MWDDVDRGGKLSYWPAASRVQYGGALTSAGGEVRFDGSSNFNIPAGQSLSFSEIHIGGGTLTADRD